MFVFSEDEGNAEAAKKKTNKLKTINIVSHISLSTSITITLLFCLSNYKLVILISLLVLQQLLLGFVPSQHLTQQRYK